MERREVFCRDPPGCGAGLSPGPGRCVGGGRECSPGDAKGLRIVLGLCLGQGRQGRRQGALGGRPGSMAAAWGWWQGAAPLHMFPPSNQAALLTTSSSAFAFQRHRGESWVSPCSPCPQPLGKWCLCGRAWSGWTLGACVLVARGCLRSSWSLMWEWGVPSESLFTLVIHSFCFSIAAKKDAKLVQQAAEIEEKAERLKEQAAELAWRRCLLPQNRVKVTLDADTAHRDLIVSEDHRSVRWEIELKDIPDTDERFESRCCVLGYEEFRDGRHWWEVEVEGEGKRERNSCWAVGVARVSVKRKGVLNMNPEEGIWAVQYDEGQLMSLTSPRTPLSLSPVPTRIWICLDCTQQHLSFINADNGVEIFTFTAANFDKKPIRPWFLLWTQGIQLCLRDSNPQTLSPNLGGSCPSPATPASPLLGSAGAAQE
uniref:B30.2/SPRY domain-containing protein n=1 Tax=Anas platyrhynchos platyrhynchos TaxID=8840 RepID=A0A493SXX7_ANAPP